jgi:hypothetical protein
MNGIVRSDGGTPAEVQPTISRVQHDESTNTHIPTTWPPRPATFGNLMTPVEAAQYLRLDETGQHTPRSAIRTLNYWRDRGQLKATKFARRVWYRKGALDEFLAKKTED